MEEDAAADGPDTVRAAAPSFISAASDDAIPMPIDDDEGASGEVKSVDPASDSALRDIFEAVLAAEAPAAGQDGSGMRQFGRDDVADFLSVINRNTTSAVSVYAFNDFRYSVNNTIEREYWLRLSRDALPAAQQALAGKDGYAILHVHYAGSWMEPPSKCDRNTITQINIRHTWDSSRDEFQRFWKKCKDLDKWREKTGRPVLGGREAPGGWKWRDPAQSPLGKSTAGLRSLLQKKDAEKAW